MLHFPDTQGSWWRDSAPVSRHWEAAGAGNLGGSSPELPAEVLAAFNPRISWGISWCLAGLLSLRVPSGSSQVPVTPAWEAALLLEQTCQDPSLNKFMSIQFKFFFKARVMSRFGAVK